MLCNMLELYFLGKIPLPPYFSEDNLSVSDFAYKEAYIIAPSICGVFLLLCVGLFWFVITKRKR